jgi:phage tail-like protein
MDLVGYKKDLTLEVMNEKGHVVLSYNLKNCWVSEYTAIPELDASANSIAIESIKFEIEGFLKNDVPEPDESSDVPQ